MKREGGSSVSSHPFASYRCGEDGLEGFVERRNKALPFMWHKRWAVLQPRSGSQPAYLLFYKKSVDARPELVVSLEGRAVLPITGRDKPTFKLAHPRHDSVYVATASKKMPGLAPHDCADHLGFLLLLQELVAWLVAIMEEIEEGSSSRLGQHVTSSTAQGGREHTIKDKDLGEWTVLDEEEEDQVESAVPNNPGSASNLSLAEWERGFSAKFKGLAGVEFASARLQYLYDRYRYARDQEDNSNEAEIGEDEDCIGAAGIELMGRDLDISPDDPRGMALTWRLAAKTMSKFTRDEFISGLQALQVDSFPKLRRLFEQQLSADLRNKDTLREIWTFSFSYAKGDEHSRVIDLAMAEVLIPLLLQPPVQDCPHVQPFLDFLAQQTSYKVLNMDQWTNLFDFLISTKADLSNYDAEAAWPVLIDDYVVWAKKSHLDHQPHAVEV